MSSKHQNSESVAHNPKRGMDWGRVDLEAYNIRVEDQPNFLAFFEVNAVPELDVPADLLTALNATDTEDYSASYLITEIDFTRSTEWIKDTSPISLVRLIFDMFHYRHDIYYLSSRKRIQLVVGGKATHSVADMTTIIEVGTPGWYPVALIVQDDRHNREWEAERDVNDPEACLIANAIGAFQEMNQHRKEMGREPLQHRVFPGVVTQASAPVFYKVDVTQELAEAVEHGVRPLTTTVVQRHMPGVPRPEKRVEEGMKPPDNRGVILGCYKALKGLISSEC
ncbi:hypothetical protein BDN70DRAFT_862791 [Pholiota conissans]|uniref:Uncharacterized protein n=1 Tax=Pholiota conissans TaxID=109636 RepID=A0A9P5YZH0_9AGAR|nr:hypothetical protein BDN70DRAFT_862791 [Pholiota conissans]